MPWRPHAQATSTATATMPSSHQWLAVATTTSVVSTACSGPIQRHRLVLIVATY